MPKVATILLLKTDVFQNSPQKKLNIWTAFVLNFVNKKL